MRAKDFLSADTSERNGGKGTNAENRPEDLDRLKKTTHLNMEL
jgi:hypothetical protein